MDQLLKQDMDNLKGEFGKMSKQMDRLETALLGSDLTKDGGLVQRIIELEKTVAVLEERIEKQENKSDKSDIYVKILWAAGGVICTSIIIALINHFFK